MIGYACTKNMTDREKRELWETVKKESPDMAEKFKEFAAFGDIVIVVMGNK